MTGKTGGRGVFTRLAWGGPLLGTAALSLLAWFGMAALSGAWHEYASRGLHANAVVMRAAAAPALKDPDGLARLFTSLAGESRTRFTLVDAAGAVLADSLEDPARMENHARRPEIAAALAGNVGRDARSSATLRENFLYVAVPLDAGGNRYALRASADLGEIDRRLDAWRWRIAGGAVFGGVALLVLGLRTARAVSRPLNELVRGARLFAEGDLGHRLDIAGSDAIGQAAAALSQMAADLGSRFDALDNQRREMLAVLSGMDEGVVVVDAGGRLRFLNPAAIRLLGGDHGDPTGRLAAEAVRQPDLLAFFRDAAASEEHVERELRLSDAAGDRWILARGGPPASDGNRSESRPEGVLAVLHDVTRMRRLERMRRDFVANVSHELRTPVTAIQGCLETIRDDAPGMDGDMKGFIDMALRNTARIAAIIADLLMLSTMENDPAAVEKAKTAAPLASTLKAAVSAHRAGADARGIAIELDCRESFTLRANHHLLEQAVGNLVDNAVRHGRAGARVRVEAELAGEGSGATLAIRVRDEGPGIDPRHIGRIFERFYRVNNDRSGSGLGLAIVKHIARAHGGDATAESIPGVGSVFTLILPL